METVVGVEEGNKVKIEDTAVTKIISATSLPTVIADPVVYKLVRVHTISFSITVFWQVSLFLKKAKGALCICIIPSVTILPDLEFNNFTYLFHIWKSGFQKQ